MCDPRMKGATLLGLGQLLLLATAGGLAGCVSGNQSAARTSTVTMLVPASERSAWQRVAEGFEKARPDIDVVLIEGPNATDLREDLYTAALLARDETFDLVLMDVTWTAKFAEAGWLRELDSLVPREELDQLIHTTVETGRYEGRLFRVPVRSDVGLLYYRRDLLEAAGLDPPETVEDLERVARALQNAPTVWGFVWPGSQYEGLVCVFLEALTGHGGFWVDADTLAVGLDRPPALAALEFLTRARGELAYSPPGVVTYKEEESRRLFQDGRAIFLRNWPYVWRLAQAEGSPIRGRVGVQLMVHTPEGRAAGTLGGWGLGISRFSRNPELGAAFIRHAVSLEGQRALCLDTGYAPSRADAYVDPALVAANPLLPEVRTFLESAVPRPVIPRYAHASDILQRHISAALTGIELPDEALREAARETRLLLEPIARTRQTPRETP